MKRRSKSRHRIVQYRGRRYSLKLDQAVWSQLEALAKGKGERLNALVARVGAESAERNESLTAALRRHCLDQAQAQALALEATVKALSQTARGAPLALIVEACPTPCLLVSEGHIILNANAGLERWLGLKAADLVGRRIDHYFTIKSPRPIDEIVAEMRAGTARLYQARVIVVRPGRLIMGRATICPGAAGEGDKLSYFVFFSEGR